MKAVHKTDDIQYESILFVINQTNNKSNGGVNSISNVLSNFGKPVIILTNKTTDKNKRWKEEGHLIFVSNFENANSIIKYILGIWKISSTIFKLVSKYRIKNIHFNDIQLFRLGIFGAKLTSALIVFNIRDVKEPSSKYNNHWHLINLAHKIISLSLEMDKSLQERLPIRNKKLEFHHIYSIVNFERFHPISDLDKQELAKILELSKDQKHVLVVAAFMNKKNQFELIKSLSAKFLEENNLIFHFIGDFSLERPYAQRCYSMAKEKNILKNLRFHGYSNVVEKWYQAADITVVASRREGLARCMIESLACGTPVVSFDVCSASEILDNYQCGKVLEQGDYSQLNLTLAKILTDEKTLKVWSENASSTANKLFSPESIVENYKKVYNIN